MSHSIIAPSSAGIWGPPDGCTGYPTMAAQFPETERHESAEKGTAIHDLAARMIESHKRGRVNMPTRDGTIGTIAPNGVVFDDEMFDAAVMYSDDVAEEMRTRGIFGGGGLGIEQFVSAANRVHEKNHGTTDCFLFDRHKNELIVWDAKFGHVFVDEFENWQGINYTAGIFDHFKIDGLEDQTLTVRIRIVQPFAYSSGGPVREWVVKGSDLRPYFNQLQASAHESLGDNPVCRTGSHCYYCPARHACTAAIRAGSKMLEATSQAVPVELSADALSAQMRMIERAFEHIKSLKTGYASQIEGLIKSGTSVPGYGAVPTKGNQVWTKPVEEVVALGKLFDKDLSKKGVITPKQAISLGIDKSVITAYSETPSTGIKISQISEKDVRRVFNN